MLLFFSLSQSISHVKNNKYMYNVIKQLHQVTKVSYTLQHKFLLYFTNHYDSIQKVK